MARARKSLEGTYLTTYPSGSNGCQTGQPRSPRSKSSLSRDSSGVRRELNAGTQVAYESEGRRFESCRARYELPANAAFLLHEIHPEIGPNHPFDHLSFSKPSRRRRSERSDPPGSGRSERGTGRHFIGAADGLMSDPTRATRSLKPHSYALFETFRSPAIVLGKNSET